MHLAVLAAEGTELVLLALNFGIALAQLALLGTKQPLQLVEALRRSCLRT